jgi:tRNA wybutosine-synthesizing protein 1
MGLIMSMDLCLYGSDLVTNAQFPAAVKSLKHVTQLYVSVDVATKERLKAIDGPLFEYFWGRFIDSLEALRDKQQRVVYCLTLVKGWMHKQS